MQIGISPTIPTPKPSLVEQYSCDELSILQNDKKSQQSESYPAKASDRDDVEIGRDLILNRRFLPRDFHQKTFDDVWRDWPEELKKLAENATPEQRREMAFDRYGFTSRPDAPEKPLQFTVDKDGWWAMNCFSCHGGKVAGKTIEGLPNSHIALETLYSDLRKAKIRREEVLSQMDLGSFAVPMGTSNGTSNAVVFGIALMSFRDKDLNLKTRFRTGPIIHHDMDAPAWWNVSKRDRLYIDGFVKKNHRALIPFVMDRANSGETMRGWEDDFKKVYAYIESLEAPKYPFDIDKKLADEGQKIFVSNCASCHGNYGEKPTYPGNIVAIDDIGTDNIRLKALTEYDRRVYRDSWFAHYGKDKTVISPIGYQAPPLDGIWASAPYFHNGSVPTLAGVLETEKRPKVWKRSPDGFDQENVGLEYEKFERIPKSVKRLDQKRMYFDTKRRGKSNKGHDFGDDLSDRARLALIEFLKTL